MKIKKYTDYPSAQKALRGNDCDIAIVQCSGIERTFHLFVNPAYAMYLMKIFIAQSEDPLDEIDTGVWVFPNQEKRCWTAYADSAEELASYITRETLEQTFTA